MVVVVVVVRGGGGGGIQRARIQGLGDKVLKTNIEIFFSYIFRYQVRTLCCCCE